MNNKLVNFGKYKNQPVEVMIEDKDYCSWFLSQSEMKNKYAWIFQAIQNVIQLEDTPEHNALQMRFMDIDYCTKLGNYVYKLNKNNLTEPLETTYTNYDTNKNIRSDIKEIFSKEIVRIILKDFASLIPIFNVHGICSDEKWKNANFQEFREYYFEKYELNYYIEYFTKNKNTNYHDKNDEFYDKEKQFERKIKVIIDEIKEDILSNFNPLISYKKIEECYSEYSLFFTLKEKVIRFDCNISRDGAEILKIATYLDKKEQLLQDIIKQIEDNNKFKSSSEPIFEKDNIDVIYDFYPSKKSFDHKFGYSMKVELKPSISEDYMSILRKANSDKVNVVFCDTITAQSTSIDNIKKAYKTHDIDLVVSSDLETLQIELETKDPLENWLIKINAISINGKCNTEEIKKLFIEAMTNK